MFRPRNLKENKTGSVNPRKTGIFFLGLYLCPVVLFGVFYMMTWDEKAKNDSRVKDFTGERKGTLTAKKAVFQDNLHRWHWLYQCDCGNTVIRTPNSVRQLNRPSCGCIKNKKLWVPIVDGEVIKIPLTNGRYALIDSADLPIVEKLAWYYNPSGYADTHLSRKKHVSMHRMILSATDNQSVDHIDHDGLNNRRSNIRLCTQSQNSMNRRAQSNNSTGIKGICFDKRRNEWHASVKAGDVVKQKNFKAIEDAISAHTQWVKELHGDFACIERVGVNAL
jgi:hypothetical protein